MYVPHFLYSSSINGRFSCFRILATANKYHNEHGHVEQNAKRRFRCVCLTIETQAGGTNSSTSVRISVLSQGNCLGQSPVPCPQHTGSQPLSGENAKVVGKSDRHFCWLLMSRAAIRCDGAVSPPESPPESLRMSRPILAQPGPAPPCGVHSILLLGAKHPSSSF